MDTPVIGRNLGTKARILDNGFTVVADPESADVEYGYHLVNNLSELRVRLQYYLRTWSNWPPAKNLDIYELTRSRRSRDIG